MSATPPPESPSRDQAILEILQLAAPVMEAYATSHQLHEWHCRVEDLIGTAYPSSSTHTCRSCTHSADIHNHPDLIYCRDRKKNAEAIHGEKGATP